MLVIPVLGMVRQEDLKFKATLSYMLHGKTLSQKERGREGGRERTSACQRV
jgi:hypothetical protein